MAFRMSETPATIRNGGPTLGQHNDEVFGDILGMDSETVQTLRKEGVI